MLLPEVHTPAELLPHGGVSAHPSSAATSYGSLRTPATVCLRLACVSSATEQSCVSFTLQFPPFHPCADQEERFEVQPMKRQVNTFAREVFSTVKIAPCLNFKIFFSCEGVQHTRVSRASLTWIKYRMSVQPFSAPPTAHPEVAKDEREGLKETRVYLLGAYDF